MNKLIFLLLLIPLLLIGCGSLYPTQSEFNNGLILLDEGVLTGYSASHFQVDNRYYTKPLAEPSLTTKYDDPNVGTMYVYGLHAPLRLDLNTYYYFYTIHGNYYSIVIYKKKVR